MSLFYRLSAIFSKFYLSMKSNIRQRMKAIYIVNINVLRELAFK